ncbi:ABC transporter permease [Pendulispora albinea]|uniref:ABC transporter permease n=1 Tax=Pendulispora albinea TaxID=2741071 RepID=A0ABZ2M0X8_9BACT
MINLLTLAALIRKELLQVSRDKRMLAVMLVVPIVQVTVFGYAANLELTLVRTVVVDENHTRQSHELAEALVAEHTFHMRYVPSVRDAEEALRDGTATAALVIPRDFSRHLGAEDTATVQILLDGSDPSQAQSALAAFEQFIAMRAHALSLEPAPARAIAAVPSVIAEPRLLFNPGLKSRLFMVPGTAAAVLIVVTAIVTAMGLTREREVGTMEQLLVTPMSSATLMVGKTIPYAMFGLVDETVILLAGNLLFDVPIRSLGVIFLATTAYLTSTLGIGLFVATFAKTQQQAIMAGFFILLPAVLLSGFLTSVDSMPAWIQPLTWIDPMRYFVEISRSVLLRHAGLRDVLGSLGALTVIGAALLAAASWQFRRQIK